MKLLALTILAALASGCVVTRTVRIEDGRRVVEYREEAVCYIPGEVAAAMDDRCSTVTTTKRTMEGMGMAAIGAAAGWLASGALVP